MGFLDHVEAEAQTAWREFAESVVWTPQSGPARTVQGVVDRVSELSDISEVVQYDGVAVTVNFPTAFIPGIARGDGVTIRGEAYRVIGLEPDGTGRTIVVAGV